jgi:hypothetical protein
MLSGQYSFCFPRHYYFLERYVPLSHLLCIDSLIFAASYIGARGIVTPLRLTKKTVCAWQSNIIYGTDLCMLYVDTSNEWIDFLSNNPFNDRRFVIYLNRLACYNFKRRLVTFKHAAVCTSAGAKRRHVLWLFREVIQNWMSFWRMHSDLFQVLDL